MFSIKNISKIVLVCLVASSAMVFGASRKRTKKPAAVTQAGLKVTYEGVLKLPVQDAVGKIFEALRGSWNTRMEDDGTILHFLFQDYENRKRFDLSHGGFSRLCENASRVILGVVDCVCSDQQDVLMALNKDGNSTVHFAMQYLSILDKSTYLKKMKKTLQPEDYLKIINSKNKDGLSPLGVAVKLRDRVSIQMLLGDWADQKCEIDGLSPLHYAIQHNLKVIFNLLLKYATSEEVNEGRLLNEALEHDDIMYTDALINQVHFVLKRKELEYFLRTTKKTEMKFIKKVLLCVQRHPQQLQDTAALGELCTSKRLVVMVCLFATEGCSVLEVQDPLYLAALESYDRLACVLNGGDPVALLLKVLLSPNVHAPVVKRILEHSKIDHAVLSECLNQFIDTCVQGQGACFFSEVLHQEGVCLGESKIIYLLLKHGARIDAEKMSQTGSDLRAIVLRCEGLWKLDVIDSAQRDWARKEQRKIAAERSAWQAEVQKKQDAMLLAQIISPQPNPVSTKKTKKEKGRDLGLPCVVSVDDQEVLESSSSDTLSLVVQQGMSVTPPLANRSTMFMQDPADVSLANQVQRLSVTPPPSLSTTPPSERAAKRVVSSPVLQFADQSPSSCRLHVPSKGKIIITVSGDAVGGGAKIGFVDGVIPYLQRVAQIDAVEEAVPPLSEKNPLSERGIVKCMQTVKDRQVSVMRGKINIAWDRDVIAHAFTTELMINVLLHGSTYLQRSQENNNISLLVVACVACEDEGCVGGAMPHFVTMCFSLDNNGIVSECYHWCMQEKHPKDVCCGGKYRLFPVSVMAERNTDGKLKFSMKSDFREKYQKCEKAQYPHGKSPAEYDQED